MESKMEEKKNGELSKDFPEEMKKTMGVIKLEEAQKNSKKLGEMVAWQNGAIMVLQDKLKRIVMVGWLMAFIGLGGFLLSHYIRSTARTRPFNPLYEIPVVMAEKSELGASSDGTESEGLE